MTHGRVVSLRTAFEEKYSTLLHGLSNEQLYWLNEMIVDTLNLREQQAYQQVIRAFKRGDKVGWENNGVAYTGWVTKTNQKSVNVTQTEPPYKKWKIDPHFLHKL